MFQYQVDNVYGEYEKDPNVVFAELDKGLHSLRIGEQCAAIVRYPELFENYPFPIMIKSSFVKLANVFRSGTNFLRLCVVQVAEQSSQHLEKIGNVDEIVRCIHSVIYSNDPVARALTLRLLGSMACIISEQKFVHHSILSSLDSHDKVEVLAAVAAASAFASKSKSFANSICSKLLEMIDRLSVPVDMKARFIHVCTNMMCDADTSFKVRSLCLSMLKRYPASKFVSSVLHTLTLLSCRSLVHLSEQVDLLQTYLTEDSRTSIKVMVLSDLKLLALKVPHVWTDANVKNMHTFVLNNMNDDKMFLMSLQVMSQLSSSVAVHLLDLEQMKECYMPACYHGNLHITLHGLKLYVDLTMYNTNVKNGYHDDEDNSLEELLSVIEMLMMTYMTESCDEDSKSILKEALVLIQKLCSSCPSLISPLVDHVTYFIADDGCSTDKKTILCDFLSSVHANKNSLPNVVAVLRTTLRNIVDDDTQHFEDDQRQQFIVSLLRVILQYHSTTTSNKLSKTTSSTTTADAITTSPINYSKHGNTSLKNNATEEDDDDDTDDGGDDVDDDDDLESVVSDCVMKIDGWMAYKVGRQLARYAYHKSASKVFSNLGHLVYNECKNAWLEGLTKLCKGESLIRDVYAYEGEESSNGMRNVIGGDMRVELIKRLINANDCYQLAVVDFKASACLHHSFFQITYTNLRCKFILCCANVLQACCSFQTVPPPAIATSLAINTGQESHKCEHVLNQLKSCIDKLATLEQQYQQLHCSCFDADQQTLQHINILMEMCRLVINVLSAILNHANGTLDMKTFLTAEVAGSISSPSSSSPSSSSSSSLEDKQWKIMRREVLNSMEETLDSVFGVPLNYQIINHIERTIHRCTQFPLHIPRFFFQKLQTTDIKLAISPPMKNPDDPFLIKCDTQVAIKVEGIVSCCCVGGKMLKSKPLVAGKKIRNVQLIVTSEQTSGKANAAKSPPTGPPKVHFIERCPMQVDYFHHKFLILFSNPGIYQVSIEAKIIDDEENVWTTGVKSFLLLQAYDEALLRQQQQMQTN